MLEPHFTQPWRQVLGPVFRLWYSESFLYDTIRLYDFPVGASEDAIQAIGIQRASERQLPHDLYRRRIAKALWLSLLGNQTEAVAKLQKDLCCSAIPEYIAHADLMLRILQSDFTSLSFPSSCACDAACDGEAEGDFDFQLAETNPLPLQANPLRWNDVLPEERHISLFDLLRNPNTSYLAIKATAVWEFRTGYWWNAEQYFVTMSLRLCESDLLEATFVQLALEKCYREMHQSYQAHLACRQAESLARGRRLPEAVAAILDDSRRIYW